MKFKKLKKIKENEYNMKYLKDSHCSQSKINTTTIILRLSFLNNLIFEEKKQFLWIKIV